MYYLYNNRIVIIHLLLPHRNNKGKEGTRFELRHLEAFIVIAQLVNGDGRGSSFYLCVWQRVFCIITPICSRYCLLSLFIFKMLTLKRPTVFKIIILF